MGDTRPNKIPLLLLCDIYLISFAGKCYVTPFLCIFQLILGKPLISIVCLFHKKISGYESQLFFLSSSQYCRGSELNTSDCM